MRDSSICHRLMCYQVCLEEAGSPEKVAEMANSDNCLFDRMKERVKNSTILGKPVELADMEQVEIIVGEPLLMPGNDTPNIDRLKETWQTQWVDTVGHKKAKILYPDGFEEDIDLK